MASEEKREQITFERKKNSMKRQMIVWAGSAILFWDLLEGGNEPFLIAMAILGTCLAVSISLFYVKNYRYSKFAYNLNTFFTFGRIGVCFIAYFWFQKIENHRMLSKILFHQYVITYQL